MAGYTVPVTITSYDNVPEHLRASCSQITINRTEIGYDMVPDDN